jgi:DNA-binding transcriptional MerR regulator
VLKKLILLQLVLLLLNACSTEKNTFLSRNYHGMTARYNGMFNANELLKASMLTYRASLKEDYYGILPIEPIPLENEAKSMYAAIDTAIVKCTKVIQNHSMPSNDRPSKKKVEHNAWIDENWITIGKANFYRRDYEASLKSFDFVRKFYSNDPSIYVADLWMAKTNLQLGNLTDAGFNLAKIEKALEAEKEAKEAKKEAKSSTKSKKKLSLKERLKLKKDKPAIVPKSIRLEYEKTYADLELRRKNPEEGLKHLLAALKLARKQLDKSRLNFNIAQFYEIAGNRSSAKEYYGKCLKYNAPYEMHFNAKMKRAFMGGDEKIKKDLQKMLKDGKNAPFKDQIYYALASTELQENNVPLAKNYLTESAFYAITNKRQKGLAFEKLADLAFAEKKYIAAQKYYDSCAVSMDTLYPNGDAIKNKAKKLADLVAAVEIAEYEDSVQRIAKLPEGEREKFLEKVIKQQKEEEIARKKKEAERLRELQQLQAPVAQTNSGKWYFNNSKTRDEGFNEFRKLWGSRENEDNWRRSEKTPVLNLSALGTDSTAIDSLVQQPKDSASVENYMAKLPLTDSSLTASMNRMFDALYTSGMIYKEQLNEPGLAKQQFGKIISKEKENSVDLAASYQLFKFNDATSNEHKNHILTVYPNSDYANFIRDPEYFIKRKEIEAFTEKEYLVVLDRYNRALYAPVIARADIVIEQEKDNKFRAKYMLLKALSIGQTSSDKKEMLPVLNLIIKEYPKSDEEAKAQEMINIINKGYSKNEPADFTSKSVYSYNEDAEHWAIIVLDAKDNSNMAKNKISDFNHEYFSRDKLKVSSKIFGNDTSVVLVQKFTNDTRGQAYLRIYKSTKKHLLDLKDAKILLISQDNMKILFERKNFKEYELFYDEFY